MALVRVTMSIKAATWSVFQAPPSRVTLSRLNEVHASSTPQLSISQVAADGRVYQLRAGPLRAGVKQGPGAEAFKKMNVGNGRPRGPERRGIACLFR